VRFDYVIFRYNDKDNNTSPYIIITKVDQDYSIMMRKIGRKHPRKNFLHYIIDNIITDSNIRLWTNLKCIEPPYDTIQNVLGGLMEIGKGWLEINLKEGYKINYYREVHCL
jgi:hypothetical protein